MSQDERPAPSAPYDELRRTARETAVLTSVAGTVGWDQETMMPEAAAPLRGEQMSMLAGLVHERRTSARVGDLIAACEADAELMADPVEGANVRAMRRDYDRSTKLPGELVREFADTTSRGMHAWREARERSDFSAFVPWLEKVVRLNRDRAACYGVPAGGERYDALLDEFEQGMTTAELRRTFTALRQGLTPLIRAVAESGVRPQPSWQKVSVPIPKQDAFNRMVMTRMGFDFGAGRLDQSAHPFCEGIGPGDTRLTTRYREDEFASALNAAMHETGHGLYEHNLPKAERMGQPLAEAASTGIHESQSRMWENLVGRSRPFWEWALPRMREDLGAPELAKLDVDTVWRGVNVIEPNLIRIESDEATYNLHIMLRFDLERALLEGDLAPSDLPGAWNERVKSDLGLDVPDDRRGCLQDIHWSMGAIGYFPTYTLGNLYAAQFWVRIRREMPDLDDQIRRGEMGALLEWLRTNIHVHGRRFTAPELCQRVSGAPLSHEPLLDYLRAKASAVYGV